MCVKEAYTDLQETCIYVKETYICVKKASTASKETYICEEEIYIKSPTHTEKRPIFLKKRLISASHDPPVTLQ